VYSSKLKYFKDLERKSNITPATFQVLRLFYFLYMSSWKFFIFVVACRHYHYILLLKKKFIMLQLGNSTHRIKFVLCFV